MTEIPPSISLKPEEEDDPDVRDSQRQRDLYVVDDNELYEDDYDQDGSVNMEEV